MIRLSTIEYLVREMIGVANGLCERVYGVGVSEVLGWKPQGSRDVEKYLGQLIEVGEGLLYRGGYRYLLVGDNGELYVWGGMVYERVDNGDALLREIITRVFIGLGVNRVYIQRTKGIIVSSVLEGLGSAIENRYVPNHRYVAFSNGVFDVEEGVFLTESCKEYRPWLIMGYPYMDIATLMEVSDCKYGVDDNPCRRWDKFMGEVFDVAGFREDFQQHCGAMLVDRDVVQYEKICYLYGGGRNGKSVLVTAIQRALGEENFTYFTLQQLFGFGAGSGFNMVETNGKICNLCNDIDERDFSSGAFKEFVSGGRVMAGRKFRNNDVKVKPPLLICCTNFPPKFSDDSEGFAERLLVIESNPRKYGGRIAPDPTLLSTLSRVECRMYIFHWVYEGYRRLMSQGGRISVSDESRYALEVARNLNNTIRTWWRNSYYIAPEDVNIGKNQWLPFNDVYEDYLRFCQAEGLESHGKQQVAKFLLRAGFVSGKNKRKVKGVSMYCLGKGDTPEEIEAKAIRIINI